MRQSRLARRLWGSARREQPPADLQARVLAAGHAERARMAQAPPGEGLRQARQLRRRSQRWAFGLGALGAAAAALSLIWGRLEPRDVSISAERAVSAPEAPPSASAKPTPAPSAASPRRAPSLPAEPAPPAPPSPPPAAPRVAVAAPSPTGAAPPAALPAPASAARPAERALAGLAEQLGQIKRVRAALRAGDPERALALLDERSGDTDALAEEAGLLRIESLAAAGRHGDAERAAREFAKRHPSSPLIDRALSFAGERR